jgi:hypothetical protein
MPKSTKKSAQLIGQETPWGLAQSAEVITDGITLYSTASHGGYFVCPELNHRIPANFKRSTVCQNGVRGWYEEDCDWAMVVYFLKEYFKQAHFETATEALKVFFQDEWNTLTA